MHYISVNISDTPVTFPVYIARLVCWAKIKAYQLTGPVAI